MSFIQTVAPEQASGEVLAMYQRQQAHFGYLPNYARAFSHRPDVMASWATLLATIRRHVDPRRFELVTLAAAQALGNSYCALAHGRALEGLLGTDDTRAIVAGDERSTLTEAERAMMDFARLVARDASSVCQGDVNQLLALGFADEEIFDIVTVAAARAFFTKVLDGLGTEADAAFREMAPELREELTVGRAIAAAESDRRLTEQP
ncbi:carboxymuconolactone decarboxylase family protein [Halomonas sp. EGI 63088]|uniref:Carboxymuconolactone decarboxylase family protein n=1 Tax=Halomonas flagellata TaxID=2920385 RepID=A0ABS9RY64_9GAMM|nr:carboxymuconolactone decarboxylase family protein [Halomonas flagellata]MCH4564766.1 carboxymuconolactone decarboxylase family protein [Halomonas flagellata]